MQKLTLKSIARELGVSISTVSKALKDNPEISEETREKIKAFAKLYNYKPNNIALSLKNRKTKTIGVIIPEIVHYFFTTVISGIEEIANQKGYNVIIGLSNESFQKEVINMEMLANGSIDGFIISVSKETQFLKDYHHIEETISQGMPIVMFDRTIPEIACDKVIVDDVLAAKNAVLKLMSLGCNHIAIITTETHVNVGALRTKGYQKALEEKGLGKEKEYVLHLKEELYEPENIDVLQKVIYDFLSENRHIDGIFAVNEVYALSAIKAAKSLNLKIPEDVKVIGFTDGILSKYASPSLSTVSQHGKTLGIEAAAMLIQRIDSEDVDEPYKILVVETELIERETTSKI